ncbi:TIGR00730 family Rossman fold protein [Nesterenkonia sp. HG001]|uniref:LOG family protein n=1 Tax=Nesterenkonia sp. HG001 TaxID=2983207 RepID=UPI002AC5C7FB|nr:TIGR00730 family Rossman fold protein [Nesterenkonia sp. HG001]MDZ5076189.1 TIGR00730 family Rossman fold protein [Nesterenkonia sp. HG001]
MRSLTVFTGSSHGHDPVHACEVRRLGERLARQGVTVVYGGGQVGLMGVLADAALQAGGEVHGVMPRGLADREAAHPGLTRLDVVADMHERKRRMAELGEGFLAMPGGVGTLEELFEVWTWQHLEIHAKPVGLFDVDGFWQPLLAMVDHMIAAGFLSSSRRESLIVEEDVEPLIARLGSRAQQAAAEPGAEVDVSKI